MASGFITLNENGDIGPHMTFCPQCGGEAREIVLMGNKEYKDVCQHCRMIHYGGVDPVRGQRKCVKCGSYALLRVRMTENEKVPGPLCEKCEKLNRECDEAVAVGGVYWKHEECGSRGAIKASAHLAQRVRKQMKIPAPGKCGIDFDKEQCPVCSPIISKEKP